ncbi:hypothetical protein CCOY_10595 [Corynebacterium coyleae]|uniref:YPDG domain-containing protein n=1 Tax=Corynebacterium coyleae TaxID=53374 RepID=UPI0025B5729D|nr:YPDG domain-containing protein [Corynebacterium coyleae]WJY80689.1 hypothetical protein CCOY_10595 [Corynebacterium coyleae]
MNKRHIGRRRGTSVAAAALSFALVAPFAQPVAFAAETGSEVNTVDGHTAKCGLDPNDPMARYNTQLVNTEGAEVVDAIANGYTTSVTDFTNAKHTVSGFVGVGGYGTITPGTGRFVEDGTRVFMQWMDEDGTVSPVYETQTHKVGTRQGRFAFDLRDGFTDSNGNFHQFRAVSSQLIRIWAEPQVEKRSGLLMYPMRTAPGLTTGQWQSAFPAKHGTFPLVGTNYQRAHIWMGYLPIDPETGKNFMMAEEVSENPLVGRNAEGRDLGTVTGDEVIVGRVWHETGLGADQANIVTGPAFKTPASTSKDTPAVGYKVYFTTLTEEGITGLANAHEQDMFVRPGAVADLVKEHPEWLRKTWVATTDETGQYALDLKGDYDEVAKNRGYYAWVEDASGTVVQTHSVGAPMEFKFNFSRQASNWVAFPTPNRLSGAVASMNFAVTGSPEANNLALHVVNFDNMNNLAHREDVAKLAIDGALPGTANRIVWTNAAGKVVDPATGEPIEGVDPRDPDVGTQIEQCGDEANASLTVPKSAKDGDTFTAWFYAGPNPIAADSFSVTADQAAEVDPRYGDVHWDEDPETDGYQSLPPKFFKEDRDGVKVDKENDVTDSVEGEKYEFAPKFRMPLRDENGDPIEEQARNADGSPQFATEPVVDENGDPVLDDEGNLQEKQVLDDAGNPIPVMEQKIGVPEGFAIDPATGVVTIPENYLPKDGEDPVVVPVRVTYAHGSVDVTDVTFHPTKKYNDVFEPSYDTTLVVPGTDAESKPKFTKNGEPFENVPAKSKFELKNEDGSDWTGPEGYTVTVDPETGAVTVKADPEKIKELGEDGKPVAPEEFDVPVKVTYPDGTVDDATAKFQLDTDGDGEPDVTDEDDDNDGIPDSEDKNPRDPEVGNDAYVYEPKYDQDGSGKPGEDVTVDKPVFKDKDGKDTKAPEGTKFTPGENVPDGVTIDENTGEIKVTIPEDAKPGDKITVPVVVTYPDGTTDTVDVPVTVEQPDAPAPSIETGTEVDEVPANGEPKTLDDKVKNPTEDMTGDVLDKDGNPIKDAKVEIDPNTGEIKVTVPKGTDPQDATVVVKDKDGNPVDNPIDIKITEPKDETPAPSIETGTEVDEVPANGEPKTLDDKVKNPTEDMTGDVLDKDGNPIKDAKVEVDPNTGEIKVTVPEGTKPQDATVVVKDKDGNKVGEIDINIVDPKSDAAKNVPNYGDRKNVEAGKTEKSDPFEGKTDVPVKEAKGKPSAGSEGWTFKTGKTDGVVEATAPDYKEVEEKINSELPNIDSSWEKFKEIFTPYVLPSVDVDFTYNDGSTNSATAGFDLVGKDGKSLLDPNGDFDGDGISNKNEIEKGTNPADVDKGDNTDTTAPTVDPVKPGDREITGKDDRPNSKITVTFPDGTKEEAITDKDGNWKVDVPAGIELKPGDKITVIDEAGNDTTATVGIDTAKCVATSVGFGLPLIALLPIGLATQLEIPGLSDFAAQANAQIQNANTQIQQQLGIFNPQLATQVDAINAKLGQYGTDLATVAGGLALIAAGILAGTIIYDNCTPGGGSSVKDLELKGSSGKTYAGSSKEEKAPATTQKAEPKN